MASSTDICNQALRHLGVSSMIGNLATEQSANAVACRSFYETVRDATLRDFNWPFATKTAALGLVEEDPTTEWAYAYRYPSDCINMRRIESGFRNETADQRIKYKISRDDSGRLIYSDQADAVAEYTMQVTAAEEFTPDFVLAFSLNLAIMIAPQVTGGDPFKMGERAERLYNFLMTKAQAQAINEEQPDSLPEADYITARES